MGYYPALATAKDGPCADDRTLDTVLTNLEDRGLLSWDKTANRYDLHPIVRGVVWATLNPTARYNVHGQLHAYFSAIPTPSWQLINSVEELTPAIELFYTLTNLDRFEEAYGVFLENIESALLKRLSGGRLLIQLLELLLPDGPDTYPPLQTKSKQCAVINSLALGHDITGEPGKAAFFFERAVKMDERDRRDRDLSIHLCNLALALWPSGKLRHAEKAIRRAMREAWLRTGYKTRTYGVILGARGEFVEALSFLEHELSLRGENRERGAILAHIAQCYLWEGRDGEASEFAENGWNLAQIERRERDLIRTARLQGCAALRLGKMPFALERLQFAVVHARSVNFVQEELPALVALAEWHRVSNEYDDARELLEQIWAPADQGPYPLWEADARNTLAHIERDVHNTDEAIAAAAAAYRLAWCDGPPYSYQYGLIKAQRHLQELGAAEPELPPFDERKIARFPRWPNLKR